MRHRCHLKAIGSPGTCAGTAGATLGGFVCIASLFTTTPRVFATNRMSTLYLVRHGQASFFSDDYDRLSDIGRQQARRLGQYWIARRVVFDRVYTGPRKRQIDTADEIARLYAQAELPWPEPVVLDELDEYAAEEVLAEALPSLLQTDAAVRRLHEQFVAAQEADQRQRRFQKMYEVIMARWAAGELTVDGVESWQAFRRRVHQGLDRIVTESPSQSRVAAFTSGGPIGVAVERATEMPHLMALRTAWMVRNAAMNEFLFSGERFTMSSFNALGHLDDDPALLTYR